MTNEINGTDDDRIVMAEAVMTAVGVTRAEMIDSRNVYNGARNIVVIRMRRADEIEAHRLNEFVDADRMAAQRASAQPHVEEIGVGDTTVSIPSASRPISFIFSDENVRIVFHGVSTRTLSWSDWEHIAKVYGKRRG